MRYIYTLHCVYKIDNIVIYSHVLLRLNSGIIYIKCNFLFKLDLINCVVKVMTKYRI